jgi:hypothetical protein
MDLKYFVIALLKIAFLVFVFYIAYQILLAIIGGTWETENILIAGMGIILGGMFDIVGFLINQGNSLGILHERTRHMNDRLYNLERNFNGL